MSGQRGKVGVLIEVLKTLMNNWLLASHVSRVFVHSHHCREGSSTLCTVLVVVVNWPSDVKAVIDFGVVAVDRVGAQVEVCVLAL